MKLDTLDIEIISQLRVNGRMSIKDIAKNLDRRRATIYNRMKKMEEEGVIKGYTVVTNFKDLGYGITVFILVALAQGAFTNADSLASLGKKIAKLPFITEVHAVTGEFDYLIKARVKDLDTLGNELYFQLRKLYGVGRTLTLATFHSEREELGITSMNFT